MDTLLHDTWTHRKYINVYFGDKKYKSLKNIVQYLYSSFSESSLLTLDSSH